jgi:hypothetical protein
MLEQFAVAGGTGGKASADQASAGTAIKDKANNSNFFIRIIS